MNTAEREGKYSLKWANGVVKAFRQKYVRATDFMCEEWTITDEMLAVWLTYHPRRWQNFKKTAKRFEFVLQRASKAEQKSHLFKKTRIDVIMTEFDLKPYRNL